MAKIDSGVYMFRNKLNDKIYIGQSKYLKSRYNEHKSELLRGIHHNEKLQKAVNKYGFENFEYKILIKCEVEKLDFWEQYFIDVYETKGRELGYNIRDGGNNSNLPPEIIEKIRLANRGKNNKLTPDQVEEIKILRLQGVRCYELAEIYGVTISTINKITMCKNWAYIREDLNEALLSQAENEAQTKKEIVLELYNQGLRPHHIHRKTGVDTRVINNILKDQLSDELANKKIIESDVRDCFLLGATVEEITCSFNITYAQYKRITKGLTIERDRLRYQKICELKNAGYLREDIARKLNLNKGTVTDICKRFSTQANTEVSS